VELRAKRLLPRRESHRQSLASLLQSLSIDLARLLVVKRAIPAGGMTEISNRLNGASSRGLYRCHCRGKAVERRFRICQSLKRPCFDYPRCGIPMVLLVRRRCSTSPSARIAPDGESHGCHLGRQVAVESPAGPFAEPLGRHFLTPQHHAAHAPTDPAYPRPIGWEIRWQTLHDGVLFTWLDSDLDWQRTALALAPCKHTGIGTLM
jgi:hypothetical protein